MEFICLGSGSSGNAYILKQNDACVMVECGLKFGDILTCLIYNDIDINQLKGVICTHAHKDHTLALKDLQSYGIPTYTPYDAELPCIINIDFLYVYCFPVAHDTNTCGFIFKGDETMLFINDTSYFELTDIIKTIKYDYVSIECNHLYNKLIDLLNNAKEDKKFKYERQAKFHLSLINTKKLLSNLSLDNTKAIYLMHLSQEAGDPKIMQQVIQQTFGIKTFICKQKGNLQ